MTAYSTRPPLPTGDIVLITDATRALLPTGRYAMTERGAVELRGKAAPVRLWSPTLGEAFTALADEAVTTSGASD